jgi:hypothetical protein
MAFTPHMGQREDLYNVTVIIAGTDGQKIKFTFDKFSGGDAAAKETKYRPGNGTVDEETLGGSNSISNITVEAKMTYAMYQWVPWLIAQNGKADMWVNKQPLDINGTAFGKPLAYKGRLTGVTPPKTDSMSDAAGMLSLIQSTVTPVTTG